MRSLRHSEDDVMMYVRVGMRGWNIHILTQFSAAWILHMQAILFTCPLDFFHILTMVIALVLLSINE